MTNFVHFPVRGGVDTFAIYKEEVTYAVNPGTWSSNAKHFGIVTGIQPTLSRNLVKIRGFGGALPVSNDQATSRDAVKILGGRFETGFSVDFQPQEFSFLKLYFGSSSTAGSTHNYPQFNAATEADKKKYLKIPSISLATRYDFGGSGDSANRAWVFSGMMNDTLTIKAALGEPVTCSMAFNGATIEEVEDVTTIPYTALSGDDVFHFVECSAYEGGTEIGYIMDGFEFDASNGVEILGTLGKYEGVHGRVGERNFNIKLDLTIEGKKFFSDAIGPSRKVGAPVLIDSMELLLKKSNTKNIKFYIKNLKLPEADLGVTYGELKKGTITLEAEYAYAVENDNLGVYIEASTIPATVTGDTTATLNGNIDTIEGYVGDIDYWFKYKELGALVWENTTTQQTGATGAVDQNLTGLTPDTLYEFKIVASGVSTEYEGFVLTFKTDA